MTKISATPVSCWMSFRTSRYWAWMVTSRLVVGSSAMISFGPPAMRDRADDALAHAAAHLVRILAHPHLRRGNAHRPQQFAHPLPQRAAARALMVIGRLGDLAVDAEQRVQRGHRVLQDHGDLCDRGCGASRAGRFVVSSCPAKSMLPPTIARCRRQQTDDRQAGRGLAAARLADEAERLALAQGKADPVDRLDDAARRQTRRNASAGRTPASREAMPAPLTGCAAAGRGGRAASRRAAASPARRAECRGREDRSATNRPTISIDRPSASIEPQAGSGGGTPTPRKLSEASAMITTPIVRLASTIAEFSTLGRMWRKITRVREPPAISASLTNSRSRRLSTSPRMTRA